LQYGPEQYRNQGKAASLLLSMAKRLKPMAEEDIMWRPVEFASDEDLFMPNVSIFATDADGTISVGESYMLVKRSNAIGAAWTLEPRGVQETYIYGRDTAVLDHYGLGAGAPSAEKEFSGVYDGISPNTGFSETVEEVVVKSRDFMGGSGKVLEDRLASTTFGDPAEGYALREERKEAVGASGLYSEMEQESLNQHYWEMYRSYGYSDEEIDEVLGVSKGETKENGKDKPKELTEEGEDPWRVQVEASDAAFVIGVLYATGLVSDVLPKNDTLVTWLNVMLLSSSQR
jgi:hypothetical protein